MPKKPTDYSKTIIYKIYCKDETISQIYIGSTTDFTSRRYKHKNGCDNLNNKEYNTQKYQFIRANGGWDNWIMTPIEEYPCESRVQSLIREQYWIDQHQNKLNKLNSYTSAEYKKAYMKAYDVSRTGIKTQRTINQNASKRQYRIDNLDKLREEDAKKYRKQICKKALDDIINQITL